MDKRKRNIQLFWMSLGSFWLVAMGLILMMPALEILGILPGILFWVSLISGIICQTLLSLRRKKYGGSDKGGFWEIGVFRFFSHKWAAVADILLPVSIAGLVISLLLTDSSGNICFVFFGVSVASFAAHSMLNGKNYRFVFGK